MDIRKFLASDRDDILRICADTGFLGNPIDEVFQDRETFAEGIALPYLVLEPQHAFVAEHEGNVVGYLIGSTDPQFGRRALPVMGRVYAKALWRAATSYDAQSRRRLLQFAKAVFHDTPSHPPGAAHLHLNIDRMFRGGSLGLRMLREYERMARDEGVRQYYGEVISSDARRTPELYERLGFQVYDRRPTSVFAPQVPELYVMCITKKL